MAVSKVITPMANAAFTAEFTTAANSFKLEIKFEIFYYTHTQNSQCIILRSSFRLHTEGFKQDAHWSAMQSNVLHLVGDFAFQIAQS